MPDRIDSIIARVGELQKKIDDILGEGEDTATESIEPRLTIMDVDRRIKDIVPKMVIDEVENVLAKNEAITRSIVMSAIQEKLAPVDTGTSYSPGDRDPQAIPKRKPASKRKKVVKEE